MTMNGKINCSVGILTHDSAGVLPRALESLKDFTDIIICDGNSTDTTVSIARAFGASVVPQSSEFLDAEGRIINFAGVRNQTLAAAREEWFLFIDSDEFLSEELVEEIRGIIESHAPGAFWLPRQYEYQGVRMRCATTYPNFNMRLFHKKVVSGFERAVHERIALLSGVAPVYAKHPVIVPMLADFLNREKALRYIAIESKRNEHLSLVRWVYLLYRSGRVSALYLFRLVRNALLCPGPRVPLKFEMERHWYHLQLMKALWKKVDHPF